MCWSIVLFCFNSRNCAVKYKELHRTSVVSWPMNNLNFVHLAFPTKPRREYSRLRAMLLSSGSRRFSRLVAMRFSHARNLSLGWLNYCPKAFRRRRLWHHQGRSHHRQQDLLTGRTLDRREPFSSRSMDCGCLATDTIIDTGKRDFKLNNSCLATEFRIRLFPKSRFWLSPLPSQCHRCWT